jgi:glucose/arabinose dehydrogenase
MTAHPRPRAPWLDRSPTPKIHCGRRTVHKRGWRHAAAGLLTLLALALAACSSGDDDATQATTPQTAPPTPEPSTPEPGAAEAPTIGEVSVGLEQVAPLEGALAMHAPPGSDAIYVATQQGTIHLLRDGQLSDELVLDLTGEVVAGGEQGLLGLAVAPDNQRLYVNLTNLDEDTSIREYALTPDGRADPGSMRELMVIEDFAANHNGGQMAFGPDGMLYIATGDGGGAGDPERTAQDLGSLLGKILRIDPQPSGGEPYGIPGDNPFVGTDDARGEVYAYGLRNPWRFSFDRESGDMWIGDVGQNEIEEVNVIPAGSGGGQNFGWSQLEGTSEYYGAAPEGAVDPVIEYPHENDACTVIGGEVYRGSEIPGFQGAYVYADYCAGWIAAASTRGGSVVGDSRDLGVTLGALSSFGSDQNGELYVLSLGEGIHRLVAG